ncbi:MAG: transcription antitermination factor NusB [Holosporaceae bacterium]|jgi:N utilization substance protein B|nr:transcription antitermination factor NusB [Holosporaceae bacterium]
MEEKKGRAVGGLRSVSRFYAVQTIYRAMMVGCPISKIINESQKHGEVIISEDISVSEADFEFFRLLLETAEKHLESIDEAISQNLSSNWKIDRLDSVMKSILRLGAAELMYLDIPPNVVFNEYIEISKSFFEKSDVAFANGLLNSILQKYPRGPGLFPGRTNE